MPAVAPKGMRIPGLTPLSKPLEPRKVITATNPPKGEPKPLSNITTPGEGSASNGQPDQKSVRYTNPIETSCLLTYSRSLQSPSRILVLSHAGKL